MARLSNTIANELIGHLRYLNATRSKMEHLYKSGYIVRHDIEQIYEGLFIDAITSFEGLIEKLFIGLLIGNIKHASANVVPRVAFKSAKVAREIVLGGKPYVDWLPYNYTEQRANAFFRNGHPFTFLDQPEKNSLAKLWWIRNAIAHISQFSMQKFQQKVIGPLPLLSRERTPSGFLRSVFRARPIQTQYEVSIIEICNLAFKIC